MLVDKNTYLGSTAKRTLDRRMEQRGKNAGRLTLLHIGPNDFWGESMKLPMLFGDLMSSIRLLFVEPQLHLHPFIKQHAAGRGFLDVTVLHAAVGFSESSGDEDATLTLWGYNTTCVNAVGDAFGMSEYLPGVRSADHFGLSKVTSTSQSWVSGAAKSQLTDSGLGGMDRFEAFVDRLRKCVVPMVVPLVSPQEILHSMGVQPETIDFSIVDAEGVDIEIMNAFLALPGFSPAIMMWETGGHSTRQAALLSNVSMKGYDIHSDCQ